jgi:hypothetical protein
MKYHVRLQIVDILRMPVDCHFTHVEDLNGITCL